MANSIYDVLSYYPGTMQDSDFVFAFEAPRSVKFTSGIGFAEFPPTAAVTLQINKNGSSAGTIDITTAAVFTFNLTGGEVVLADGDKLTVEAPSSGNTVLGNVSITFLGQENPDAADVSTVYDFSGYASELILPAARIMQWLVGQNGVTVNGGTGTVEVGSNAPVTFNIRTFIGTTLTTVGIILVNGTVVTVSISSFSLSLGNLLIIESPSGTTPVDTTLKGLAITFTATRTA